MERLEQFRALKEEIREDAARLHAMEHADEMREAEHACFMLTEQPADETRRRAACLTCKLALFTRELQAVEEFIDGVTDSQTRRALKLHYIDGLSWCAVAHRMHYATESGARNLCKRYIETVRENN